MAPDGTDPIRMNAVRKDLYLRVNAEGLLKEEFYLLNVYKLNIHNVLSVYIIFH